ncbi:universal stress protein [Amycolatopsis sp. GM8]|uniref:universal stress protein n=1 Tax=Amycolatopsis sp. GM8 TaxID=2896530 RepID=UPI001F48FC95|nr:universal stress protein [Amycolatopsis sp. GM8]
MTPSRKIVVGVDGSPQSEAALRWAIDEASTSGARVRAVLVRARDPLLPGTSYAIQPHGRRPVADREDYVRLLHTTVEKSLQGKENPPQVQDVVADGDPAKELIRQSGDADLLVVGSPGTRLLSGGVATRCVRHAHCPVVVLTAEIARRHA